MDACRRRRQLERELQHAWRSSVCDEVFFIENSFLDQLLAKIEEVIINVRLPTEYKSADYARAKATSFGIELFKCWLKHASAQRPRAAGPHARVLIANEESESPPLPEEIRINYTSTRWCVDSGANRDICREPSLFNGNVRPKVLTIGEAGQGHSFMSQGEGSIALHARGKQLPLFSRAIYAADVQENIMSVPEACDRGYAVVFTQKGVQLFNPEDVKLRGAPVLSGGRDKRSRLFYFDFPSPLLKEKASPAIGEAISSKCSSSVQRSC